MQVGRGPTQKLTKSQLTIMCRLAGPNIEKLDLQFLQAMQVGVWAQHREFRKRNSTGNAGWGVGPHREIGTPISIGNASWRGPTQKLTKSQLTIMCRLAGPQHREFQKRNSTGNASWGRLRNNFLYSHYVPLTFQNTKVTS